MEEQAHYYSKQAGLIAMANRFREMGMWEAVEKEVQIKQKIRSYTALEKLLDVLLLILTGGHGLVEINTRLRSDVGLQRAFGRKGCAEQSTISDTLTSCSRQTIEQMRKANTQLLQRHGQVMQLGMSQPGTPGTTNWLVLDADMTGLAGGKQGEGVSKGYFGGQRDQRGRQLGRVLATDTDEILVERLFNGKSQLEQNLLTLVDATMLVLQPCATRPENIIWRIDAGGGTDDNINTLLKRGYHVLTKAHNWQRAERLARSVSEWVQDPKEAQRMVGWVGLPYAYTRSTRQLTTRVVSPKGKVKHRVLITSLSDEQLCDCFGLNAPAGTPWPLLYAYDLRGGGIETQNRCDKQGLGLGHRYKSSFLAQEMLILLGQHAHNFIIWMRNELARTDPHLAAYGLKRMVRDVFGIDGIVHLHPDGGMVRVDLNPHHPLSAAVTATFCRYE